MRRNELDVIVVGAGAIGCALALALSRDGFAVAMVEGKASVPEPDEDVDARVVALAPDSRELLEDLDAWPWIQTVRAHAYRQMRVWDASVPGELHFDAADNGDAALGWIVENRLIQHALWRNLIAAEGVDAEPGSRAFGGSRADSRRGGRLGSFAIVADRAARPTPAAASARVLCPANVVDIENADDHVTAVLDDGTRLRARLLVVAEGAGSMLREKLGIAFAGRDYHQRAVVAHVGTTFPHQDTAWQRFQPGGPLAFLPLADGRSSVVWSLPDAQAARVLALDDPAFRAELGAAFDFRLGAITSSTPRLSFPLRLRLAERYVAGRCLLAGDSAHVVHPLAGQGMNLGFRDVRTLRRVLAEASARGGDPGAAHVLRRYERERRSENVLAAGVLDGIERTFGSSAVPAAGLRAIAFAAVERIPMLRHAIAAMATRA